MDVNRIISISPSKHCDIYQQAWGCWGLTLAATNIDPGITCLLIWAIFRVWARVMGYVGRWTDYSFNCFAETRLENPPKKMKVESNTLPHISFGHLEPRTKQEKSKHLAPRAPVYLVNISIFESTGDLYKTENHLQSSMGLGSTMAQVALFCKLKDL